MNRRLRLGGSCLSNFTVAIAVFLYLCTVSAAAAPSTSEGFSASAVQKLTDSDWEKMLSGEWLVKFYAPWCPACQSLIPVWESLGRRANDIRIKVADVDVTENAALSGRFFVTSLPTIYHVKDGVFRQYKRSRSEDDLISFVVDRKWAEVEPLPWYQAPDSYLMRVVSVFFQGSIAIRNLHTSVTTEYGIPVWVSYVMIALMTLLVGLALGLGCVCLCDMMGGNAADPRRADDDMEDDDDVEDDDVAGKDGSGDKKSLLENLSAEEDEEGGSDGDDREGLEGGDQVGVGEERSHPTRRRNIQQ